MSENTGDRMWSIEDADDDLLADLKVVGIEISSDGAWASLPEAADATDAAASQMLRLISYDEQELDRISNACDAEIALITERYKLIAAPTAHALAEKIKIVERIALSAGFQDAKKKSRATPYGKYGIRHQPQRFEVTDPAQLLAWAKANAPAIVSFTNPKPVERVTQTAAEEFFSPTLAIMPEKAKERIAAAGCRIVEEYDKPFFELTPSSK